MMGDIMTIIVGDFIKGSHTRVRNNLEALAKKLFFSVLALALGGCAIHPVQQDVTRFPTKEIVKRIRCETKRAVEDKAIDLLSRLSDSRSRLLAEQLANDRTLFARINPATLPRKDEQEFYSRYINTAVAYEFSFDIAEDNKAALLADPVRLITNGTAGIVIGASSDFNRSNIRRFALVDTFKEMFRDEKLVDCYPGYKPQNFVYPIAGTVGMADLISTFIDVSEHKFLAPASDKDPSVFGDTMKFTTTLIGSATPHVELSPLGNNWGLASPTNIGLSASRTDVHQLTVGLSMGAPESIGPVRDISNLTVFDPVRRSGVLKSDSTGNQVRALNEIENQRLRNFYDRVGTFAR
jgi:hypothetical protein